MIKKIIKIKSIGKFIDYAAAGDVEFRKLTLIYAENGRGKTTVCDILRSLQTGNGDFILGRKTLGNTDDPEVCIRLDHGNAEFHRGAWTAPCPELMIFESTFVHNNVYAGDYVDHDHKKNLYRVIVGEEGVRLAGKVDDLDRRIRDANRDIGEKRAAVQGFVPSGLTIDNFMALEEDSNIEQRIREQEQEVRALEQADNIRTRNALKPIVLPALPEHFVGLLARQLDDVSDAAESAVRAHITTHLDQRGEAWVEQGLGYVRDNKCAFCGQRLDGVALIQSYRDYFSQAYRNLKNEIVGLENALRQQMGERALVDLQRDLSENEGLGRFWEQFVEVHLPLVAVDELRYALEAVRRAAHRLVDRKKASPLEPVRPDGEFDEALALYSEQNRRIQDYNSALQRLNEAITAKKAATAGGNLQDARRTLSRHQAVKRRYELDMVAACGGYETALVVKATLEREKGIAKEALDVYGSAIFARYQNRINELLGMFGAGFRIGDAKGQYVGGTASSSYRIVINSVPIELGDSETPIRMPSFKNTLSAGDRSTLGLAFFLAQLDQDQAISGKVVILDDAFTSQDRFRRTCTQQLIRIYLPPQSPGGSGRGQSRC